MQSRFANALVLTTVATVTNSSLTMENADAALREEARVEASRSVPEHIIRLADSVGILDVSFSANVDELARAIGGEDAHKKARSLQRYVKDMYKADGECSAFAIGRATVSASHCDRLGIHAISGLNKWLNFSYVDPHSGTKSRMSNVQTGFARQSLKELDKPPVFIRDSLTGMLPYGPSSSFAAGNPSELKKGTVLFGIGHPAANISSTVISTMYVHDTASTECAAKMQFTNNDKQNPQAKAGNFILALAPISKTNPREGMSGGPVVNEVGGAIAVLSAVIDEKNHKIIDWRTIPQLRKAKKVVAVCLAKLPPHLK